MTDVRMVFMTVPDSEVGARLVRHVVEEQLAACGNLIPGVRSIYRWKGEVCDDAEILVILKTTTARLDLLRERLVALHPYDCPEVVAVPVTGGHSDYLDWVVAETTP